MIAALAVTILISSGAVAQAKPVLVDPPALDRRDDLIGKEVAVDGRVRLYQYHEGRDFDEILLDRTDVLLRLPPDLRFRRAPTERVVRVEGILRSTGQGRFLDVRKLDLLPDDRSRLARGVGSLAPDDEQGLKAWAAWAEYRAELYGDDELRNEAAALLAKVIARRADDRDARDPVVALKLAEEARTQARDERMAAALALRAFATRATQVTTSADLEALAGQLAAFLPAAKDTSRVDLKDLEGPFAADPFATALNVTDDQRKALARKLLADVIERSLILRSEARPADALTLADEAAGRLPDRPDVAARLRDLGLAQAARDVGQLRRAEVLQLSENYASAGQPDRGKALILEWLKDYRENRLGRNDIDGRLALAQDYLDLVQDRPTAVEILREAAAVDPSSERVVTMFRRLGFRRDGENWVDSEPAAESASEPPAAGQDDPILGMSPEEVFSMLGKPNQRAQCVTQGRVTIQWIYRDARGSIQVIEFLKQPGFPPRVVGRFTP